LAPKSPNKKDFFGFSPSSSVFALGFYFSAIYSDSSSSSPANRTFLVFLLVSSYLVSSLGFPAFLQAASAA
jgi:hypothetical protein